MQIRGNTLLSFQFKSLKISIVPFLKFYFHTLRFDITLWLVFWDASPQFAIREFLYRMEVWREIRWRSHRPTCCPPKKTRQLNKTTSSGIITRSKFLAIFVPRVIRIPIASAGVPGTHVTLKKLPCIFQHKCRARFELSM